MHVALTLIYFVVFFYIFKHLLHDWRGCMDTWTFMFALLVSALWPVILLLVFANCLKEKLEERKWKLRRVEARQK